jgi:hypothetical protein
MHLKLAYGLTAVVSFGLGGLAMATPRALAQVHPPACRYIPVAVANPPYWANHQSVLCFRATPRNGDLVEIRSGQGSTNPVLLVRAVQWNVYTGADEPSLTVSFAPLPRGTGR